jgi:hypothetical protein
VLLDHGRRVDELEEVLDRGAAGVAEVRRQSFEPFGEPLLPCDLRPEVSAVPLQDRGRVRLAIEC